MKKKTLIALVAAAAAVVIAGLALAVVLLTRSDIKSIEVTLRPFKTAYTVGEAFDPTGMAVKAVHKTGETIKLAPSDYTVEAPKLDTAGDKTVQVKYKGKKAAFPVSVSEAPAVTGIRLDTDHINYYFTCGMPYSKENSGLVVYELLSDGRERVVNTYTHSVVDTATTGKKTVTVNHGSFSQSYDIEVVYGLHFVPVDPRSDENKYLYMDWNSDQWGPPEDTVYHRSADGDKQSDDKNMGAYFTYYVDYGSKVNKLLLLLQVRYQTKVEVSYDNIHFQVIDTPLFSGNMHLKQYDLTVLLDGLGENLNFTENQGRFYFRFSDLTLGDGFGADLYDFKTYYDLEDPSLLKEPAGYYSDSYELSIKAGSETENTYLYAQEGSSVGDSEDRGQHRFNNAVDSYFTYGVDLGGRLKNLDVVLHMQGQTKLEASLDGKTWQTVCAYKDYQSYAQFTFPLGTLLKDFQSNNGKIYLRFTDTDNDGSFGADLFDLTLRYTLENPDGYKAPKGIPYAGPDFGQKKEHSLEILPYTNTEKTYLYGEAGTHKMEDEEGTFRFIDGADSYFIYGVDTLGHLQSADIRLRAGQMFQKVQVSFDGNRWHTVLNKADNMGVKDYAFDLTKLAGFEENTGKIYVRFSGGDGYDGSFGICLYTFKLNYSLASGVPYREPVGITADTGAGPSDEDGRSLAFEAYSAEEMKYLYEEKGTNRMTDDIGTFRFIDGTDSYFIYGVNAGSPLSSGKLTLKAGQIYQKAEVSFDGRQWNTVLDTQNSKGVQTYTFDLTAVSGFQGNDGRVYVRFSGSEGYEGGFGITVYEFGVHYTLADDSLYQTPDSIPYEPVDPPQPPAEEGHTLTFAAQSDKEESFLYEEKNTHVMADDIGTFRFIDGADSFFTYGIDAGSPLLSGKLTLQVGQIYQKIELSFDGTAWSTVLNIQNAAGVQRHTFDLTAVSGFSGNSGRVYVRFSGSEGYEGGFGITVYDLSLQYRLADESRFQAPVGIPYEDRPTPPVQGHSVSLEADTEQESNFLYEEKNTHIAADDIGVFRFIDGTGSYFIYGVDAGSSISSGRLTLLVGQIYQKIELSFDGTTWSTVLDTQNADGVKELSFDLTAVKGFSGNDGRVYVRFSGGEGYEGGFGITVYTFGLHYELVDEGRYQEPQGIPAPAPRRWTASIRPDTESEQTFLYEEKTTHISTDGEGTFRFIDGPDSSFTYGLDMGSRMNAGSLTVKAGQIYKRLEVSFDGEAWQVLLNTSENPGVATYTFDLGAVPGFTDNTGKLYLRFAGADGYEGGFGITVYDVRLAYGLLDESLYILPTGIARAPKNTYTLQVDAMSETEQAFLYKEQATGHMTDSEGTFRFIDGAGSYFIYGVDAGSPLSRAELRVKASQMHQKIEVSLDAESWQTLRENHGIVGVDLYRFDLTGVEGFAGNTGRIYVRFSGGEGYEGSFGICVYSFQLDYQLEDDSLYQEPVGIQPAVETHTLAFTPFTDTEGLYLYEQANTHDMADGETGEIFRFIDGRDSFFIYGMDAGSPLAGGELAIQAGNIYKRIQVSFDGMTWLEVLNHSEGIGVKTYRFDLSTLEGFADNTGKVFVRFSGGDGYEGGFGITVYRCSLTYTLADAGLYTDPVGIPLREHSYSFHVLTEEEQACLLEHKDTGDMEDSEGQFRFINSADAYLLYGLDTGSRMSGGKLSVKLGQQYRRVELSFDGNTWQEALNESVSNGVYTWECDLGTLAGFESNSGRVYVRLSGGDGYTGSFGIIVYGMDLRYTLVDDGRYAAPGGIPSHTVHFHVFTDQESTYLYEDVHTSNWNNGEFRFIDGEGSSFTYGLDLGSRMTGGRLGITIGMTYKKIEVSFDGSDWQTMYDHSEDLGQFLWQQDLAAVPGFADNTGKVYVRFSGGQGYTGGFGIKVVDFDMTYTLLDEGRYIAPEGIR